MTQDIEGIYKHQKVPFNDETLRQAVLRSLTGMLKYHTSEPLSKFGLPNPEEEPDTVPITAEEEFAF
jgi:hypothetical protein